MSGTDSPTFVALFKEAYQKCFGHAISGMLSETESRFFSEQIFGQTGLVIGPKSIKNYSTFVTSNANDKNENPSVATLDTLARYLLNAPYTDEIQRKNNESHYPYWFQYKEQFHRSKKRPAKKRGLTIIIIGGVLAISIIAFFLFRSGTEKEFTENFRSVSEDSLSYHGWLIQSKEIESWNKRGEKPGHLTLFTLKGDSWPDSTTIPGIKNFLLKKIRADCFTIETRLSDFFPSQNWQQAGILLLEDSNFTGKSMRVSFAYNDYFGGYKKQPEIIIQAITSNGKGSKPEEFFHQSLFTLNDNPDSLVIKNLRKSAIRIEKRGEKLRILYSTAPVENFAFKEAVSQEFLFQPKYVGLFALKGQVDSSAIIPASFKFFSYLPEKCK